MNPSTSNLRGFSTRGDTCKIQLVISPSQTIENKEGEDINIPTASVEVVDRDRDTWSWARFLCVGNTQRSKLDSLGGWMIRGSITPKCTHVWAWTIGLLERKGGGPRHSSASWACFFSTSSSLSWKEGSFFLRFHIYLSDIWISHVYP
jgi:hypothetical protein